MQQQQQRGCTSTTTTTEMWQWSCSTCKADWKMVRQVTTCCPHGCFHGAPPAGNPHHHHHHHHRHHGQQQATSTTRALAAEEEESSDAARRGIAPQNGPTAPAAVAQAQLCWQPDAYLMVQQLREFEALYDEVAALRVQLEEYAEEIERSTTKAGDHHGHLAADIRDVLATAKDAIHSFVAISSAPPAD